MPAKATLLVGTKKGAWILTSTDGRKTWTPGAPVCFGQDVQHFVQDPRAPRTMIIAARPGHLGPTLFRSSDGGRKWKEVSRPPAFRKAETGSAAALAVSHVCALAPALDSQPGVWYAGTSPQGLFRSDDGGDTWEPVDGFNLHPKRGDWCGDPQNAPPDGARLHSILIDPRDPAHLYIAMSSGGVFESTDAGTSWTPINKGQSADFLPSPDAEYGHDPHCVRLHPLMPDRIYQQNHCGIYRMDRAEPRWIRIGEKMPRKIGDVGFPIVLHPRDPDTAWVFPMDATAVWPRTSPGGKPAVYRTRNAGRSWQRLDRGLPESNGWFTVFRQAMTADGATPLGLYFGTTQGEIWSSRDEGESWKCILRHLPRVHSVEIARV